MPKEGFGMDWKEITWWICMFLGAAPAMGAFLWHIWEFYILTRRVPREEIERLADEIMRKHANDPDYRAYVEEYAAWDRSNAFEQGKWRRVRKHIAKVWNRKGKIGRLPP
ncbi:hypothetical protein [Methylocystis sp. S23]